MFQLTWVLPILLACTGSAIANLTVLYEWNYIDYGWLSPRDKEWAIDFGRYTPTRITINDIQPIPYNRLLVTTPKVWDNPASLSYISFRTGDAGFLLAPYPNWSYHKEAGDCSGITSASKVKLDACNRLWVVDSGKIRNEKLCPPRLFVFDARTDDLLLKVPIPQELAHNPDDPNKGRLEIQAVETEGDECQNTTAYIGDSEGWGLIVFDGCSFWRLNDHVYAPDEGATVFNINGDNVTLDVGLSSAIIPPAGFIEEKTILFKPLASNYVYGANLQEIRNQRSGGKVTYYRSNTIFPYQGLASDISSQGVIIYGINGSLACWNVQNPLTDSNAVYLEQSSDLPFVSGLKIYDEHVWIATTNLNTFLSDSLNVNQRNFRILKANLTDLIRGTNCEPKQHDAVKTLEDLSFSRYEEYPDDPDKGRLEIEAVETKGDECQNTVAYIGDSEGWGLIVFDGYSFWRLNDQVYAPEEGATIFKINGDDVTLDVGLFSAVIPPAGFIEEDTILFKALASDYVYGASIQEIRNQRSGGKVTYYKSNTILPSQGHASDISSKGVIISGFGGSLACWNVQNPYEDPNLVFFEQRQDLPFVSGLKIYDEHHAGSSGENVWIAAINLNTYLKGNLNVNEVNFRIFKGNVADLVQGTYCEPKQHDAVKTLEDLSFYKYEE